MGGKKSNSSWSYERQRCLPKGNGSLFWCSTSWFSLGTYQFFRCLLLIGLCFARIFRGTKSTPGNHILIPPWLRHQRYYFRSEKIPPSSVRIEYGPTMARPIHELGRCLLFCGCVRERTRPECKTTMTSSDGSFASDQGVMIQIHEWQFLPLSNPLLSNKSIIMLFLDPRTIFATPERIRLGGNGLFQIISCLACYWPITLVSDRNSIKAWMTRGKDVYLFVQLIELSPMNMMINYHREVMWFFSQELFSRLSSANQYLSTIFA